jgi:hypothetical protein
MVALIVIGIPVAAMALLLLLFKLEGLNDETWV